MAIIMWCRDNLAIAANYQGSYLELQHQLLPNIAKHFRKININRGNLLLKLISVASSA